MLWQRGFRLHTCFNALIGLLLKHSKDEAIGRRIREKLKLEQRLRKDVKIPFVIHGGNLVHLTEKSGMGTSYSTWRLHRKTSRSRKLSDMANRGSITQGMKKSKSEGNLLDEIPTQNVYTNPLYRHQDLFDNDLFFEEILAKIEREAARLSTSDRKGENLRGFDSFMMY